EISAADNLFKLSLEPYYKRLKETQKNDGSFDAKDFQTGYKNAAQHMEDSMFTMFNVMYGEKIDADWLQDAYLSSKNARRSYKYKRLAQNQGYSRNSNEKRQLLKNIYAETSDKRYRKLIDTYTEKENIHTLVIEDGVNSITGEAVNNFITDNRSVSEANLKKQYNDGDITESVFNDMMKTLKEGHSVNAAASNGMTAVNRDLLDYLLLLNGQEASIGHSAGQKPVGLSSYTDQNGVMHVFYNKTHYFYDSRLDNFFKNNKEIDQVAFTSGAKKSKIINPKLGLDNQFKPYEPPKMDSGQNIVDFINGISVDSKHQSVMPVKFDQTLSGTIYGKPHDARILKQFDNWSSKEVQLDLYEWSRADMARELASVNINLYNPEDVNLASNEARSFMRSTENKDGVSVEAPNASVSSIWMESGGVPFSEVSKNLYDALIKKRYIDNSGLFDGYTDAGGVPVLRSNLTNDLNIPVFSGGKQIKLGEANVGEAYLDRTIHFRGDFGTVTVDKQGLIKRDSYRNKSTLTVAFAYEGRDVIVNLKTNHVFDPYNLKVAKLSDYKDISTMVESLQAKLKEGKIEKYRDLYNELLGRSKGGESFTTAKGSVYTVDGTTTRRTKAARPEHPGDAGLKDKSTVTLYMEEITARSLFGKPFGAMSLAKKKFLGFNKLGVTLDGKTYGAKSKPKKGLLPVEFWIDSDGKLHDPLSGNVKSYHIGNKIVEIHKGGEFNYKGAQLVIMAMPAPRTGPHDAMVVKVKNILPSKDGGIMELNSYDVTMRGQRDYDTDKLPFYMDTPFSAVNEAYSKSGSILEALPLGDSNVKELDMYSNRSYKAYNQNIQDYKRKRGPIIKMHRKLTYAKRIFDEIGEIDLGGGHKIVFTENINRAMQSLVNDSQGVLDIYDGTPESMKKLSEWTNKTLFGNNAFFKIKTENGKETTISNAAHKVIVEKILNDFSNLLTLEGNIYEAGQAKQPRYQDMVSTYRDFQAEYSRGAVNWNFYHYMVKRGFEPEANRLFFGMDAPRKDAEMVGDVFGSLSEQIHEHPTPFMKSLNAAVNTDFNKTRETYSPSGDYFNKGIDELLGRHRANMLMHLQGTGIKGEYEYNKADDALEGLWKTFYKRRKDEEMGVQVNVLQEQIRRSEWRLSEMEKNPNADKYAIELQKENLLIKNESLTYILNKMSLEEGFLNQKIIKYRDGANNEIKVFNKDIVIRDGKTGKYIKKLTEDYTLRKNEVAVFDPVV
ncbi:MAG: hypothetical protein H8E55_42555, partial [Pelagibacterales bacterium]|nr:hypothetical protein [Pelagibacterales bacterium]